ncbi:MAG: ABC transporter permease [Spirochaetes bacterium]|nr:MAG: ABC transporter permease [Spirochaetota bacterium]
MRFLISLAWKNLSRYRKRTIITASAIAVGIGIYIFFDAWLLGAELDSERNLIWYETSSIRIMDSQYWEEQERLPLDRVVENPEVVIKMVEEMNIPAVPRIRFGGEVIFYKDPYEQDGGVPVQFIAIDPERDDRVFPMKQTLESGKYLKSGKMEIMIGSWFAEDIGAEVGYPLTIVTRTRDGFFQTIDVEIAGIINCPNPMINNGTIFIPMDVANNYLQMEGGVTEMDMSLPLQADVEKTAQHIEERLEEKGINNLVAKTWKDLAQDYLAIAVQKRAGSNIMLLLVFIIAAVGVSNTMLMAIYERVRELGMMRALGMKDSQIRIAFILEAGGIGFIGSVAGTIFGSLIVYLFSTLGIDYSWIFKNMNVGYRLTGVMYTVWNPEVVITAFIVGIVISMLIAYIPTRRALKMQITDCLRNE